MLAASRGKLQIMELLMAEEVRGEARNRKAAARNVADVKLADMHQWTPLMHAASADQADAVRLLLKFGSEVSPMCFTSAYRSPPVTFLMRFNVSAGC